MIAYPEKGYAQIKHIEEFFVKGCQECLDMGSELYYSTLGKKYLCRKCLIKMWNEQGLLETQTEKKEKRKRGKVS